MNKKKKKSLTCLSASEECVTVNSTVDTVVIALMLQELTLNIDQSM